MHRIDRTGMGVLESVCFWIKIKRSILGDRMGVGAKKSGGLHIPVLLSLTHPLLTDSRVKTVLLSTSILIKLVKIER
jgi:hypothetical protein